MSSKLCPFCMRMSESEICPHCGKNTNYAGKPMHLPAGYVVDGQHPYVIGAALGQGGFGITYIALDMVSGERVAIKEYFPTFCCGRTGENSVIPYDNQEEVFWKGKDRFLDEARVLKSLSDLKSIVNVLDFFEFRNSAYLVMEYLDGSSLKEHAAKNGKFPAQKFFRQIQPLMEDLERMHQRGVVHRDIAPDNIILQPDGQMKLIDFGAARSFVGDKSMTVVVKKGFAPVEQYLSKGVTPATDVYALAATIYYCITGTVPLDSAERQYEGVPLQSPSSLGADITPIQEKALDKALEIQQETRTQTVQEFLEQLSAKKPTTQKSKPDSKKTDTSPEKTTKKKKKKFIPILAATVAALALIAGFFRLPDKAPAQTAPSISANATTPSETQSATENTTAPTTSTAPRTLCISKEANPTETDSAFDSKYPRVLIKTITFLDSVDNAPYEAWDASQNHDRTVLAWVEPNGYFYDLFIGAEGGVLAPKDCCCLFSNYINLIQINFNGAFDTTNVTDMNSMFYNCNNLTELDVSNFNTFNVTDMSYMFSYCPKLTKLDVSGFDTKNVTNMGNMFYGCDRLTTLDVSGFDTTNVKSMYAMFYGCKSLATLDVSHFDTTSVTNMSSMFNCCSSLTALDVSGFDTANVTNMYAMFYGCDRLTTLDVSGFDTIHVTDMARMFGFCCKLTALDVSDFDTANVTTMCAMFSGCNRLTTLDISHFDTANVTNMGSMFSGCDKLAALDVSHFDVSKVRSYSSFMDDGRTINGRPWQEFFEK